MCIWNVRIQSWVCFFSFFFCFVFVFVFVFFLLEIKILYFPKGLLIPFQSSPARTPYQMDVTPYINHSLLLLQNQLVTILTDFPYFFLLSDIFQTLHLVMLDYHGIVGLATTWTVISFRTQSRLVSAFCCIMYLTLSNNSKPHNL